MTTAYANAINASAARLQYINEVARPALIAAQTAAMQISDDDSLEADIAMATVAGLKAQIEYLQASAKKFSEYAEELRGEVDL